MDLQDAGSRARYLIRDRDGKYPALSGTVLKDAGTEIALSGVQMPRMNAITERRVLTCRRELPGRTLTWNQRHLLHALRESGQSCSSHRPHQGIANARPLQDLPPAHPPAGRRHTPPHPQARPPRRHPPRVPACCQTRTDVIIGKDTALAQPDAEPALLWFGRKTRSTGVTRFRGTHMLSWPRPRWRSRRPGWERRGLGQGRRRTRILPAGRSPGAGP